MSEVFDVFGEVAEEEDVLLADLAGNFDVSTVAGANYQATVEDELLDASVKRTSFVC